MSSSQFSFVNGLIVYFFFVEKARSSLEELDLFLSARTECR